MDGWKASGIEKTSSYCQPPLTPPRGPKLSQMASGPEPYLLSFQHVATLKLCPKKAATVT